MKESSNASDSLETLYESYVLCVALIKERREFTTATGYSIRYIDIVVVCYGSELQFGISRLDS